MRQIVLDTETTGLKPQDGHRIIEIGAVEVINRRLTGNYLQCYLNPERDIDAGAVAVHGLTLEFLANKPRFSEVVNEFLQFINGAELIIHNAPFDLGFLHYELHKCGMKIVLHDQHSIIDTLPLARQMHPGQKNNLDALCKRYAIDNTERQYHGAHLDAMLLARVYLAMTSGQDSLLFEMEAVPVSSITSRDISDFNERDSVNASQPLIVIMADEAELQAHREFLNLIHKPL